MKIRKKLFLVFSLLFIFLIAIFGISRLLIETQAEVVLMQNIQAKLDTEHPYKDDVVRIEFKENVTQTQIEEFLGKDRAVPKIFEGTPYEKK